MDYDAIHGKPTVTASNNFNPVQDAEDLREAMKRLDENILINILCRRTYEERQEIIRTFKTLFKRDLFKDVKSVTSGHFRDVLLGLLMPQADFICTCLKEAMKGLGADENTIIQIAVILPNSMMKSINETYLKMYKKSLESELKSELSGNIRTLVLAIFSGCRNESVEIDVGAAKADAYTLYNACTGRLDTDEEAVNTIFCQRNYQQLDLIFKLYEKKMNRTIEKVIESELSGDSKKLLLAICKCIAKKSEYFAEGLYNCSDNLTSRTNSHIIRILITRCDVDLKDIKKSFEKLSRKTLAQFVKEETRGDYQKALLALLDEG